MSIRSNNSRKALTVIPAPSDHPSPYDSLKTNRQKHATLVPSIPVHLLDNQEIKSHRATNPNTLPPIIITPKRSLALQSTGLIKSCRATVSLPIVQQQTFVKPPITWNTVLTEADANSPKGAYRFQPGFMLSEEQQKEECEVRSNMVRSKVRELSVMEIIEQRNRTLFSRSQIEQDTDKACELAEPVLTAMGVQVRCVVGNISDSGMKILPLNDKFKLGYFYKLFIPEMCRFNFTFLSRLRLNTLSVCESLQLTNRSFSGVLNQKLYSGMFVMDRMEDRKSIQQHWFKIVLYHFLKIAPKFYEEWQALVLEKESKEKVKPFDELLMTFNYMLGIDKEEYEKREGIKMKEQFLREAFAKFELLTEKEGEVVGL